ncbi:hypothetical protein J1N09_03630 [Aureitalea sp. L0-47]|uniref:FG-GAP repeat protein n=1 Tax=Aureitalea sp. L0-47 TaxID=2816962 RepID=UPI002238A894|nr:FG-GAP repeat protein [Aureitalea sp. L0-47]MCW5518914.1 hypothetical protein [Aureitalea sp. L0-47]
MKTLFTVLLTVAMISTTFGQVGIGTTSPQGALDVASTNMGLVMPRVSSFEALTDGSGGSPVDGTMVYDQQRSKTCIKMAGRWVCTGFDSSGSIVTEEEIPFDTQDCTYIKASNTNAQTYFGNSIAMSNDGNYLVIGSNYERSNATGINGDQTNISSSQSGAVYVFIRSGSTWSQQAYIKASNTDPQDQFGISVAINSDGSRIVVGAWGEDSNATGVNGDETNNSSSFSGAAYVFVRSGTTWSQEAYLKASNTDNFDGFGESVSINADGSRVVVTASGEESNATGVNGNEADNSASSSGAAYVFVRSGSTWSQEAYIKASNTELQDSFGRSVSLSGDASRLVIGASQEDSNATGINGNQADNSANRAGAAYVYVRSGSTWTQEAYVKASNTDGQDNFGQVVKLDADGNTMVVSSTGEDSSATGINGNESDNSTSASGAVYVFTRSGSTWTQQAYIKASNTDFNDLFGVSMSLTASGDGLLIGAPVESGYDSGIGGDQSSNDVFSSGAAYLLERSGSTWSQSLYIKACNVGQGDRFGSGVALNDAVTYLSGSAPYEDSNATGINGDLLSNSSFDSGAVYVFEN